MEMKRGVIDSDHYFCKTFKPIIYPLNTTAQNNNNNDSTVISIQQEDNALFTTPHQFKMYDKRMVYIIELLTINLNLEHLLLMFMMGKYM